MSNRHKPATPVPVPLWTYATSVHGREFVKWCKRQGMLLPERLATRPVTYITLSTVDRVCALNHMHISRVPERLWRVPDNRAHLQTQLRNAWGKRHSRKLLPHEPHRVFGR